MAPSWYHTHRDLTQYPETIYLEIVQEENCLLNSSVNSVSAINLSGSRLPRITFWEPEAPLPDHRINEESSGFNRSQCRKAQLAHHHIQYAPQDPLSRNLKLNFRPTVRGVAKIALDRLVEGAGAWYTIYEACKWLRNHRYSTTHPVGDHNAD